MKFNHVPWTFRRPFPGRVPNEPVSRGNALPYSVCSSMTASIALEYFYPFASRGQDAHYAANTTPEYNYFGGGQIHLGLSDTISEEAEEAEEACHAARAHTCCISSLTFPSRRHVAWGGRSLVSA